MNQIGYARVRDDITCLRLHKDMDIFRLYPLLENTSKNDRTIVMNKQGTHLTITEDEFNRWFTVVIVEAPQAMVPSPLPEKRNRRGRPKKTVETPAPTKKRGRPRKAR